MAVKNRPKKILPRQNFPRPCNFSCSRTERASSLAHPTLLTFALLLKILFLTRFISSFIAIIINIADKRVQSA